MRKEKQNQGITLIALVITIIVLLILAGVTVVTLTGDNGLLTKAGEAKNANIVAEIKERIQLAVISSKTNSSGELKRESLEEELSKEFGTNKYELISVGKGYVIIVGNVQYKIEEDGKVNDGNKVEESNIEYAGDLSKGGQYDGLTEETAYRITCIEDLVEWTNKANNYSNKFIKLEKTIDFQNTSDYKDYKKITTDINGNRTPEALITELTTGTGFKPISGFSGTFDGQNKEIRNIYEDTTGNAGLFASTLSPTIKNIGVTGTIISTVSGDNYVGGIIGGASANTNTKIYNCYNNINIEATNCNYVGGLIGGNHGDGCSYYIYNSHNLGKISGGNYAGGIIGKSNGGNKYIINCYNLGSINGNCVGGLIGYDYYNIPYINNSFNVGDLDSTSTNKAGGLCYTTMVIPSDRLNKAYYLDDGKIDIEMVRVAILGWKSTKGSPLTKEYIQSQEFVNELNTYVASYNEEHKNDEGFVQLKRWKYNVGNYPIFE